MTNDYLGALGVPAVLKDTEFPLVTRPAPVSPLLTVISSNSNDFTRGTVDLPRARIEQPPAMTPAQAAPPNSADRRRNSLRCMDGE